MPLRDYLAVVRRHWIGITIAAIAGAIAAAVLSMSSTPVYTATAQNFVALTSGTSDSDPLNGAQFAAQRVKSYTEIVSSPDVLAPVVAELGLQKTPAALGTTITVTNPPSTVLLLVSATDSNPVMAAEIANAVSVQLGKVIGKLETPNAATVAPVKVTLTDPATPPTSPSAPRTRTNIVLGFIVGLGVGVAYAFGRNAFDNTVKTQSDLDRLVDAPALGAVLFDPNAKHQILSALDSKSAMSEGYRTVRTNLKYINVDDPVSALVITSAAPGEGKSTVACNLAIAAAQADRKVCLVESDLRRPRVTEYLQIPEASGLTEVLAGQIELDDALRDWGHGLLTVLPPGAIPPNPSEILGSLQMAQTISNLKAKFDLVILDTPPLLAVSDAAVLASQTDGAIVVVRHGGTSRDAVSNAVAALNQVNARILGTVLNAVPAKRGYGYGYGYGYDAEKGNQPHVAAAEGATRA